MCTEDSPSGLWRTLGKRVGCKPSGVRIPHPPPPDPGTASGSGVFVVCCLWCRWCSGRWARPLCVPVGGGPSASRPRCELRSVRRLEAWPGHDAAQRCCRKFWVGQACGDVPCLVAAARVGRKRVCWGPVLRVTVSSEPPQGRNAARIRVRCRVRGGSLYMLLDHGRLQDALLRCGSGHSS